MDGSVRFGAGTNKRSAKTSTPVASASPTKEREKVAIVDEEREVSIQVLYSTVTFRPGQKLTDKRLLQLAEEHNIAIRYK